MTRDEIKKALLAKHKDFGDYILSLNESDFTRSRQLKWTAGQQLDHICRSTSLLPLGLTMPRFMTRILFGKPNRPSMDYHTLVKKYGTVLANGGKASGIFIPRKVNFSNREQLANRLLKQVSKINAALDGITEADLDEYRLPHPLLGKLTLREMMYFTLYHVDHHKAKTAENLTAA
jgi:hypothetical protein